MAFQRGGQLTQRQAGMPTPQVYHPNAIGGRGCDTGRQQLALQWIVQGSAVECGASGAVIAGETERAG